MLAVPLQSDLALTISIEKPVPREVDTVVDSLSRTNDGPAEADTFPVTDVVPAGVTYVSDTSGGAFNSIDYLQSRRLKTFIRIYRIVVLLFFSDPAMPASESGIEFRIMPEDSVLVKRQPPFGRKIRPDIGSLRHDLMQ